MHRLPARLLGWSVVLVMAATAAVAADYDTLVENALTARNEGELTRAEAILREAYDLASDKREVDALLATVLAFQKRYDEADALLSEGRAAYPGDSGLELASARVAFYRGSYADANSFIDALLVHDPENAEARNLLARIAFFENRLDTSRQEYERVLSHDSTNLDALVGLYDVEMRAGNRAAAAAHLARAEKLAPERADVEVRLARDAKEPGFRHQITGSLGLSDANRAWFARWRDRALEYRHISAAGDQQFLRIEDDSRFGKRDRMIEGGAVLASDRAVPLDLAVAVTGAPEFLPRYRWRIGAGRRVDGPGGGVGVVTVALQQARYVTGITRALQGTFEYFLPRGGVWVVPGIGTLEDENSDRRFTWQLGINDQITPRLRAGATYIDAPETEDNVTTESRTGHVYLRYEVTANAAVRADLVRSLRRDSYTRESAALSLELRF